MVVDDRRSKKSNYGISNRLSIPATDYRDSENMCPLRLRTTSLIGTGLKTNYATNSQNPETEYTETNMETFMISKCMKRIRDLCPKC